MPLPQHRLAPFVLEPFRFTWKSSDPEAGHFKMTEDAASNLRHPICRVIDWQNRLKNEPGLTKMKIGCDEGLSKVRMTQMFSLLRLPDDARQYLSSLTSPAAIRSFAIRRLMALAQMPPDRQREAFKEMRDRCVQRGG